LKRNSPIRGVKNMTTAASLSKYNPSWHHTMIRVKDPKISLPFYQNNFGMTHVHHYHFTDLKFSLYFLTLLEPGVNIPGEPGSSENEEFLWTYPGTLIELTHNHGSENDDNFKVNNGNVEPHRGFGHIAFNTDDVDEACDKLEKSGAKFQKKPNEGRMKGLAFALDPDGYWIEIVKRGPGTGFKTYYNLSQTMIRVKDPAKSLLFYKDVMGMTLVGEKHFSDFSLSFLATIPKGVNPPVFNEYNLLWSQVLELTHNHGTESNPSFSYHNGNDEPKGFGHLAFLVDDLNAACTDLENLGYKFKKKPNEGAIKGIAFVFDPDNYWVELIQRGTKNLVKS